METTSKHKTMETTNKHKQVHCHYCLKLMRSDTLNRHVQNKHADAKPLDRRHTLLRNNEIYFDTIAMGNQVFDMVYSGEIEEDSLSKEHDHAFGLYRKRRPILDVSTVELRRWQEQFLRLVETPSSRQIIWIMGHHGNEGKSFMQRYMQSVFGFSRVACLSFKCKINDTLLALSKCSLSTIDIFLFNDSRSCSDEIKPCYSVLEVVKDGIATSGKYHSEVIQFKTPNVVVVFSNSYPEVKQLSRDRWLIFSITEAGLVRSDGKLCEQKIGVDKK